VYDFGMAEPSDPRIEKQQGHGLLRSRPLPEIQFGVEYSIRRQSSVQRTATSPRVEVMHLGKIEYIRALNGANIARGQYDLEISADGTTEILGVQKRLDDWEFLPV